MRFNANTIVIFCWCLGNYLTYQLETSNFSTNKLICYDRKNMNTDAMISNMLQKLNCSSLIQSSSVKISVIINSNKF